MKMLWMMLLLFLSNLPDLNAEVTRTEAVIGSSMMLSSVLDAESTYLVVRSGGHELNPLFRPFAGNRAAGYSVKLAVNGLFWYGTHKTIKTKWKRYLILGGVTVLQGALAYHNYKELK